MDFQQDEKCKQFAYALVHWENPDPLNLTDEPDQCLSWICHFLYTVSQYKHFAYSVHFEAATYYYHFCNQPLLYESKFETAVDLGNCRNLCKLGIGKDRRVDLEKQQDYNDVVKYIFQ